MGIERVLHLGCLAGRCLDLEGAALHRRYAVAQSRRRVGKQPCVEDRADGGFDVTSLERGLFGLPSGLKLG